MLVVITACLRNLLAALLFNIIKDGYSTSYSSATNEIGFWCDQRVGAIIAVFATHLCGNEGLWWDFKYGIVFGMLEAILDPEAVIYQCSFCQKRIHFSLGWFSSLLNGRRTEEKVSASLTQIAGCF